MDCLPIVLATADDCIRTLFPGNNQMKKRYSTSALTHPTFYKPATHRQYFQSICFILAPSPQNQGKEKEK